MQLVSGAKLSHDKIECHLEIGEKAQFQNFLNSKMPHFPLPFIFEKFLKRFIFSETVIQETILVKSFLKNLKERAVNIRLCSFILPIS